MQEPPPSANTDHPDQRTVAFLHLFLLCFLLFGLPVLSGCDSHEKPEFKVTLSETEPLPTAARPLPDAPPLRIAISAVISPKETFGLYKELLDHISRKIGRPTKLIQRETYDEVNSMVRANELELAFVCSGSYVDGHDDFGMELLVAPVANGQPVYYSYIIVPAASTVTTFEELRGKRFAFTDPMSNTGWLAPVFMLARQGERPTTFFAETMFTNSHDRSIEMVANGLVDGAAIDGLILDYLNKKKPELTARTRIISKSEPYGIPPVVVPPGLDSRLKESLRSIFLTMHEDEEGRKILAKLDIDRYIVTADSDYDSIRRMKQSVLPQ